MKTNTNTDLMEELRRIINKVNSNIMEGDVMTSSFLQLGGDSIQAMTIAAEAMQELNIKLKLNEILSKSPLINVLNNAIYQKEDETIIHYKEIDNLNNELNKVESNYNLANINQQGMWFKQEISDTNAYNLVFKLDMQGSLDLFSIKKAVDTTIARHEGLNIYFKNTSEGITSHVLENHRTKLELVYVDNTNENIEDVINSTTKEIKKVNFNLTEEPPIKFILVTDNEKSHHLFFITHHLLLDGWAVGLFLEEIIEHYRLIILKEERIISPAPKPRILKEHVNYIRNSGIMESQLNFWKESIKDFPTIIEMPSSINRPKHQTTVGRRIPFYFSEVESNVINKKTKELGITKFSLFLAAYGLMLSKFTDNERLLIGIPTANRDNLDLQKLVTLCSNMLPVPIMIESNQTIYKYIWSVQESLNKTLENSHLPFSELVQDLDIHGDTRRNPLVQYVFAMHDNLINRNHKIRDLNIHIKDGHGGGSPFDMSFFIQEASPTISGEIEYGKELFLEKEINNYFDSFKTILNEICLYSPDTSLKEVKGISQHQLSQIEEINKNKTSNTNSNIEDLFNDVVKKYPFNVAVESFQGNKLEYNELDNFSSIQAQTLINNGVNYGDRVIISIERSIEEIVALLGILKAGASYVAVDPDWPANRLNQVIEETNPSAAIVSNNFIKKFQNISNKSLSIVSPTNLEKDSNGIEFIKPNDKKENQNDRLAYISFTSGSTGKPKGVAIPHKGVIRLVNNVDYVKCGSNERFLRFAPIAFDASTLEIWGPLLNGGTCVIYPSKTPSLHELGDFIKRKKITRLWLTSGLFRLLAEFTPENFSQVKQLLTGGDIVSPSHVKQIKEKNPNLIITNGYGPTENTTFTTTYSVNEIKDIEDPLPIGQPIPNTSVYILDKNNNLLPPGAIGELYVGGAGLAREYVNNNDETNKQFQNFSPDIDERLYKTGDLARLDINGNLNYLGRKDQQVKIRGHRIEINEVQTILKSSPDVKDAVVVTSGETSSDRKLLAGIVFHSGSKAELFSVQEFVRNNLPKYMVPSLWAIIEKVPVNANGKVDRKELERISKESNKRNPLIKDEKTHEKETKHNKYSVKEMYLKILEKNDVDENESFFNMGGDSLKMAKLIGMIKEKYDCHIPIRDFYSKPTLNNLRILIDKQKSESK